jgi:signal transduction histidine kinase
MKIKLKIKNLLWLLIVAMVILTSITTLLAFRYFQEQTADSLKKRVGGLAITIDSDIVNELAGTEDDLENPAYLDLKNKLISLREINDDTRFIYLMGKQNGQIFFYVDSEPDTSEDYSPPGQTYDEASEVIYTIFENKTIESETISDRWGKWLSYMAPIIDEQTGEVVAVVGIDVTYNKYITSAILFSLLPLAIGLIIIVLLITALVYARKEEEILKIRSEYFAIAAHDLRTPLTGIKWAMNLLSKLDSQELAKKCKPIFKQIDSSTENMICSVNELLDSSNLDKTSSQILQLSKVEINDLVKSTLDSLQVSINDKQLTIHLAQSKPTNLTIDKDKMRRVLSNIYSNAIKYSSNGGVIQVTTKTIPNLFIISVKDNGIGIPNSEQEKIFSGYYRASNAKEFTTQGTGLGLYYAKNIVELHGGKITLHSQANHGTDIIISLPINK